MLESEKLYNVLKSEQSFLSFHGFLFVCLFWLLIAFTCSMNDYCFSVVCLDDNLLCYMVTLLCFWPFEKMNRVPHLLKS